MNNEQQPLFVRVETWNATTNECESVRVINFHNRDARHWLGGHSFWALNNGRGIVTRPFESYAAARDYEL